jgi:HK97 family phage portal protein
MRIFGFDITRATPPVGLTPPAGSQGAGWFPIIREHYTGAWQENAPPITPGTALSYFAVFGCVTLIASDIGKLQLRLVEKDDAGIWTETTNPAYSPVLRKPNRYQTIVKFVEQWITSKLTAGNAYVLKQRDERGVVNGLYVLNPARVRPLVAPDGAVYYALKADDLVGLGGPTEELIVPAREIIHDPMVTLFHPLVGVTPLYACGLAAQQGITIQTKSEQFFRGGSHPGGVLTAPGEIGQDQADRIKKYWEENFSGQNAGRVAVVGKGLKYEPMTVNAADAQLIEQLNWTAQQVCTCYHVPPALLDLGESSGAVTDLEALLQKYHSQCIQSLLTNFEHALDEGLELKTPFGTEFNIDDLIWMVTATKTKAAAEAIGAGALSPNEARRKWFGLGGVTGGDTPYMQQQNFSLAALAERDADQPFSKATPAAPATAATPVDGTVDETKCLAAFARELRLRHAA